MRTKQGYTYRFWEKIDFDKYLKESDFDYYLHLKARFFPRLFSKYRILLPQVDGIFVKKQGNKYLIALVEHKSSTKGGNTFKLEQTLLSNIMYYSRELKQTVFIKPKTEDNVNALIYHLKEDNEYRKRLKIFPKKPSVPEYIKHMLTVPDLFQRKSNITLIEVPKKIFKKIEEVHKETENTTETQKRDEEYSRYWEEWNAHLREIYKNKNNVNKVESVIEKLKNKILKLLRGKEVP